MTEIEAAWDPAEFEQQWIKLNEEVVNRLLAHSEIQRIKEKVRSQGHVTPEDRNQFIDLVNKVKYELIYTQFGPEGSEGYEQFLKSWQHWQKLRGAGRPQGENVFENNINHLLYGSTPDPDSFLKDFDINKSIIK